MGLLLTVYGKPGRGGWSVDRTFNVLSVEASEK